MKLASYIAVLALLTWTVVLGMQSFKIYGIYQRVLLMELECSPQPKPSARYSLPSA